MRRKYTKDFLIDDTPMLDPDAGVGLDLSDILSDASGRDESGTVHNFVIKSEVKTWHFSYAWLTAKEYAYIHSLLRGKSTFSFTYKEEDGSTKTVKAYCQKKSVSYWSARRGLYKDLQFDIIEC